MIHSPGATYAVFEDTLSVTIPPESLPPDTPSRPRFHLPVDYYSSPEEKRPIFPRAVPVGCGIASVVFLLVIFIAGAIVAKHGLGSYMDPLIGMMADEMGPMYTRDVTPAQRNALNGEITRLRENVRTGKLPLPKLQAVMSSLREAIGDQKLTPAEVESLTRQMHDANNAPPPKPKDKGAAVRRPPLAP